MKSIYLLIILFMIAFSSAFSQNTKAVLIFKDGTSQEGLAKITASGLVKYRKAKGEKRVKYNFDKFEYIKLYESNGINNYVRRKVKGQLQPKILQVVTKGKVTLYKVNSSGMTPMNMGGPGGFGAAPVMYHHYSINSYYVQKEGEQVVTHLGSTELFSKNFKKAASTYFQDCSELVEKIQNKEYKKKDIENVVRFYNERCK